MSSDLLDLSLLRRMLLVNLEALAAYESAVDSGSPFDDRYYQQMVCKIEFYERLLKNGHLECVSVRTA